MTANQVQIRRDTAGNLATSTPATGEAGYDTTNKRLLVGDGSTLGGIPHVNYLDHINNTFTQVSAGGTGNAITLTLTKAPTAYAQGMQVAFKATANNTGATTININGLGTKNLQKISSGALSALVSGDIVTGGMYIAVYDGTQFQLQTLTNAGITSVSQGNLNTSTGTFSLATNTVLSGNFRYSNSYVVAPGGQYGFSLEIDDFTGTQCGYWHGVTSAISAFTQGYVSWANNASDITPSARQRYVTSSPPFDLGDGEAGGFIYVLLNNAGDIVGHYSADVPPWAYNGPTNIRCDWQCPMTGKKFRRVREQRTMDEIMDGAQPVYSMQEITMAIKNADMALIPHPFGGLDSDLTPVLLDPMDERIKRLMDAQNDGDDYISQAIMGGYIKVDNDAMTRRSNPTGCPIHRMSYKYGGK